MIIMPMVTKIIFTIMLGEKSVNIPKAVASTPIISSKYSPNSLLIKKEIMLKRP